MKWALRDGAGSMNNLRNCLRQIACGAYLASALSSACEGAARPHSAGLPPVPQTEARVAEAVRADHAPKLDGTLDDPLCQSAKPITDFRQREPLEGNPPTEQTEVRIVYTRHAVISVFDVTIPEHRELWQRNSSRRELRLG